MKNYKKLYIEELKNRRTSESMLSTLFGTMMFGLCISWITKNMILILIFSVIGAIFGFFYKWKSLTKEIKELELK